MGFRKIMVEIQGNLFELWHLASIEKDEDWNPKTLQMDYFIVLNKSAVTRDFKEVKLLYSNKEERNTELQKVQKMLKESPFVVFANDLQEDEEFVIRKKQNKNNFDEDNEEFE